MSHLRLIIVQQCTLWQVARMYSHCKKELHEVNLSFSREKEFADELVITEKRLAECVEESDMFKKTMRKIKYELECPVCLCVPTDPVILTTTGHVYSKKAIDDNFAKHGAHFCPMSRKRFDHNNIVASTRLTEVCLGINKLDEMRAKKST